MSSDSIYWNFFFLYIILLYWNLFFCWLLLKSMHILTSNMTHNTQSDIPSLCHWDNETHHHMHNVQIHILVSILGRPRSCIWNMSLPPFCHMLKKKSKDLIKKDKDLIISYIYIYIFSWYINIHCSFNYFFKRYTITCIFIWCYFCHSSLF